MAYIVGWIGILNKADEKARNIFLLVVFGYRSSPAISRVCNSTHRNLFLTLCLYEHCKFCADIVSRGKSSLSGMASAHQP